MDNIILGVVQHYLDTYMQTSSKAERDAASHLLKLGLTVQLDGLRLYPQDSGCCFERSEYIRQVLGRGSVATFNIDGLSKKHTKAFDNRILGSTPIRIPYVSNYKGIVDWAYHSVYEENGIVFTPEIEYGAMPLKEYRHIMNLNNTPLLVQYNKQRVPMRYEKQVK